MKVTLAYPNFMEPVSATPPLGIVLLGTILEKHGIDVDLIVGSAEQDWDSVSEKMEQTKPDILGISILTPIAGAGFEMARIAKEVLTNVFVVIGGPHATILPLDTIREEHVDAVCVGEGEETLIELISKLDNLEDVKGIYYKADGEIKMNPRRPYIQDLASLPFPDWSLLPTLEAYFKSAGSRRLPMLLSRGCPFNCTFCQPTLREMFGKKVRFRSIGDVVDEMEYLVHSHKIDICRFEDDTFTTDKSWVLGICSEILKRRIRIPWIANARVDTVTEEVLVWMKKAGCREINFGVESGCEYIRNSVLGKGISDESIRRAFGLCHKVGIKTSAFVMLGSPGENQETLQQTLKLLEEIKPHYIAPSRTTPLPGTLLWDRARQDGTLNVEAYTDYYYRDFEHLPIRLDDVTKEQIRKIGEALLMKTYMMNLAEYLLIALRHPLRALGRLTKSPLLKMLMGMAKARLSSAGGRTTKSP